MINAMSSIGSFFSQSPSKASTEKKDQKKRVFTIGELPEAINQEIEKLQGENRAIYSPWGKIQLAALYIIAFAGAVFALVMVFFRTFSPFHYAVSMGALGIGGVLVKRIFSFQQERKERIAELQDCHKDLTSGFRPPFHIHLKKVHATQFSIPEVLELYRPFQSVKRSIEKKNESPDG